MYSDVTFSRPNTTLLGPPSSSEPDSGIAVQPCEKVTTLSAHIAVTAIASPEVVISRKWWQRFWVEKLATVVAEAARCTSPT